MREYDRFYDQSYMFINADDARRGSELRPLLVILASNYHHGESCDITASSISLSNGRTYSTGRTLLSVAVTASAAFPLLFEPFDLAPFLDANSSSENTTELLVTDGGVVDNTGMDRLLGFCTVSPTHLALISDAGAPFEAGFRGGFFAGLKRSYAIAAQQAAELLYELLLSSWSRFFSAYSRYRKRPASERCAPTGVDFGKYDPNGFTFVTVSILDSVSDADKESEAYLISRIRTDLNEFSEKEIRLTIRRGYLVAEQSLKAWIHRGAAFFDAAASEPEKQQLSQLGALVRGPGDDAGLVDELASQCGFNGERGKWPFMDCTGIDPRQLKRSQKTRMGIIRYSDRAFWGLLAILCAYFAVVVLLLFYVI
jgi:hypothetical protein